MTAEDYLRKGDVQEALKQLQAQVRAQPACVDHRVFLFQLLSVLGQWERALTQLNVAGELDDGTLAMVSMYRQVLACERFREEVFAGHKEPVVFGRPEEWVAWLIQALKLTAHEQYAQSQALRARAFESAPVTSGVIDSHAFEWIADSDARLGPIMEAIVDGRYLWVPLQRIRSIDVEAPVDLRDVVWLPAHFGWSNGGESYGLMPARYPASYRRDDPLVALSRKTEWDACGDELYLGYGQKMLVTESNDYPLMEVRSIRLDSPNEAAGAPADV